MRSFKIFFGILGLILSALSSAEQPASAPQGQPAQTVPQPQSSYPKPVGSNPNFDDNFFNVIKKSEVSKPSPGGGGGRYVGEEPDYNTAQRAEWLAVCEPQKEVSMTAYRECYNGEKRKSQDRIRMRFKAVEDRLAGPSTGVGGGSIGVPTVDGPAREPSSGSDR